jgi:hypothetical protein
LASARSFSELETDSSIWFDTAANAVSALFRLKASSAPGTQPIRAKQVSVTIGRIAIMGSIRLAPERFGKQN